MAPNLQRPRQAVPTEQAQSLASLAPSTDRESQKSSELPPRRRRRISEDDLDAALEDLAKRQARDSPSGPLTPPVLVRKVSGSSCSPTPPALCRGESATSDCSSAPVSLTRACSGSSDIDGEEDAPPGHEAHVKVKFSDHNQGHLYHFKYKGCHLQVTVGNACNSAKHAARIARLCYLRFEAGHTKEEVLQYREELFKKLRAQWSVGDHATEFDTRAPKKVGRRYQGQVASSWASQLGSKFSKGRSNRDPLDD